MTKPIHPVALFRLSVLGPLASRDKLAQGELKTIIVTLACQTYSIPDSKQVYLSEKAIEKWYYAWRRGGIDALVPKTRCDKGHSKLSKTLQEAILKAKQDNPARSINTLIALLVRQGLCTPEQLSRASVHRLLQSNQLSKQTKSNSSQIERRAFEALSAGDIWYGDVMHGPPIDTVSGRKKTYLVSLSDDASRLICHSAFYFNENVLAIESVLKEALLKRGLPKKLVIDNGSAYRSHTLQTLCARLKIQLIYCKAYEPEGKAKLERWHRTVRAQFLTEIQWSKIDGLDALNARLWAWIEQVYHYKPHSSLNKMTPLARWQQDLANVQPLGPLARKLDEYFYHRIKRLVRNDGTVSYNGVLFEVPFELVGVHLYLVIDPAQKNAKWVESLDYDFLGPVHLLDKNANLNRKRQRPTLATPTTEPQTHFIETVYNDTQKKFALTNDSDNNTYKEKAS